uniref:Beta-1,4-endoglucanase n=1 Tax=Aphelenchoides avenae TaxID=70226 RepID=C9K4V4_APHAV|nr:beta-1,4-endoglucanase [Aphelenchus avenae]BAI44496.1 beta-1,4-endoglucanase [Aphelenchus avenae]
MKCLLIALVGLAACQYAAALTAKDPPYGQLSVKGVQLVGKDGAPVQLRGMSLFWSQWMGQFWTKDVVKAIACQWNGNLIRAAMGVDQGGYLSNKQGELQKLKVVVEAAIEAGIYVIVDWHIHEAVPTKGEAIAFFKQIAQEYGKYPHVIYEDWNEPLQVDWNSVIKPYHEEVVKAIRAVDPDNVIVLGTPDWSGASGVVKAAASPLTGEKNIMYTLHYYSGSHKDKERNEFKSVADKIPIFVTEFGISEADGGSNQQIYTDEANKWFALLDEKKISYANWAIADKQEASSVLKPGTQPSQVGQDANLSPAGKFMKDHLKTKNTGVKC